MFCRDCPRYDEEKSVCKDGKINPHTWQNAVEASQIFGVRSLCPFSEYRERLIRSQEMATRTVRSRRHRETS